MENNDVIIRSFQEVQKECHEIAKSKGWWDKPNHLSSFIANTHGELSECWEWIRKGNPESDHIKGFSGIEEELADVIIRIFDTAEHKNLRVVEAVFAKMEYNKTRSYRHGNKRF